MKNIKKNNLNINTHLDQTYGLEKQTPKSSYSNNLKKKVSHNTSSNNNDSPSKNKYNQTMNQVQTSTSIPNSKSLNLDDRYSFSKAILRSNSKNGIPKKEIEIDSKYSYNHVGNKEQTCSTFSPKNQKPLLISSNTTNKSALNNKYQSLSTRNNNLINHMHSNIEKDKNYLNPNSHNLQNYNNNLQTTNSMKEDIMTTNTTSKENYENRDSNQHIHKPPETTKNNIEMINVMNLLGNQNNTPLTIRNLSFNVNNFENSKCSVKSMQVIKAYGANTHQGIIRNYNEDRVSIILNIVRPSSYTGDYWPKSSFFGIYDGHGGASCADFLRDNLHQFIIKDPHFPTNVSEAMRRGFEAAESEFLNNYALGKNIEVIDRSGSCAVVTLIVDNICYIANVGDSRALLSIDGGKDVIQLTNDHKPNEPTEKKRIIEAGGKVYQTQTPAKNFNFNINNLGPNQILVGPHRVFPGRLSVSRTLGDVEAKLIKFGGLPNVITAVPEISSLEISNNMDFLVLGCDGIFDQLTNEEVSSCVWLTAREQDTGKDKDMNKTVHSQCGVGVDMIIKSALVRRTLDNVTCVIVAFHNFDKVIFNRVLSNSTKLEKSGVSSSSVLSPKKYKSIDTSNKSEYEKSSNSSSYTHSLQTTNTKADRSEEFILNKIDKKVTQSSHAKYESYHIGSTNPVNNGYEIKSTQQENGLTKKKNIQKKLVSLDMSKKANLTYNVLGRDPLKKKLDSSDQYSLQTQLNSPYEKKVTIDYTHPHPYTAKNLWKTKEKENNLINPLRKFPSYKGFEEKINI